MIPSHTVANAIRELLTSLGHDKVYWKEEDIAPYCTGQYLHMVRIGDKVRYAPSMVILPETTADVQNAVKVAAKYKIPIIPKGGGSNLVGCLAPIHNEMIIDTIKMNKILEISPNDLCVTVQPGITLKELDAQLAKHGLTLNQVQGSYKVATVGGSISTCGFSRKHNRYGSISDRVMSLEVVLANGDVLRTGPKVLYTSTGYRLAQLFVGAEGTLGVITEATLRVEPIAEARDAVLAYYDDFRSALSGAIALKRSGLVFVGAEAFEVPKDWTYEVPPGKNALVVVELEGTRAEVDAQVARTKEILVNSGGVPADPEYARKYVEGYEMIWCGLRAMTDKWGDSIVPYVPIDRLIEFYDKLWTDIMPKYGMVHAGAGERCGLDCGRYEMCYATFLIPPGELGLENHRKAFQEIAELVTSLGGSIGACMGVGLKHRDAMNMEFSPVAIDVMKNIKRTLDPDNLMNPGKKLP
ncbi:MAG: FAD-binding oxidoreductase [Thermoplasmata archaeon]